MDRIDRVTEIIKQERYEPKTNKEIAESIDEIYMSMEVDCPECKGQIICYRNKPVQENPKCSLCTTPNGLQMGKITLKTLMEGKE